MKRASWFLFCTALMTLGAFAQSDFAYKRKVTGVDRKGWYTIEVPPDMFAHLNGQFSDIRLYAVHAGDTTEVPYLLDVKEDEVTFDTVDLPLFNNSYQGGDLYLTFELPGRRKVNELELAFEQLDYFAFVTVEGSDTRNEWFVLATDLRVVSVSRPAEDYKLSTVVFPVTDYRYLRLRVRSDKPLTLRRASFAYRDVEPGIHREIPLTWRQQTDHRSKHTYVDIALADEVPVNKLHIDAGATGNYYRSFRIEAVQDSFKTDKGWKKMYTTLHEGHLTSYASNEFTFKTAVARELRVVIENRDNAPLAIGRIAARGPEVHVTAQFSTGVTFLLYGNESIRPPAYDLAHFREKVPDDAIEAGLGPEERLIADDNELRPLFGSKLWLWCILLAAIGVLGYFTLRMMRSAPAS